jgi:hypothetical protein
LTVHQQRLGGGFELLDINAALLLAMRFFACLRHGLGQALFFAQRQIDVIHRGAARLPAAKTVEDIEALLPWNLHNQDLASELTL